MGVTIKISPRNLLPWSHMEDWVGGASAAPTEHTLTGSGAAVARESTIIKFGTYSAKITRSSNDVVLYYDVPAYADYRGRKVKLGFWVYATVADRGRIAIDDGVSATAESGYHTGGSTWEFLEIEHDVNPCTTQLRIECQLNTGDTSVYFDGGILVEGDTTITTLTDSMDIAKMIPMSKYRGQEFRVARRAGLKVPQMQIESKLLRLEGMIVGTTNTTARTKYDTLCKAINSSRRNPTSGDREIRDIYLFDDRLMQGFVRDHKPDYKSMLRLIPVKWDFVIPDPFFRAVQKTRKQEDVSSSPTTFTVTNAGSAFSRPVITVSASGGAITDLTIENLTTGQKLIYTGNIADAKSLVVNTSDLTVEDDGSDDLANTTGDIDIILVPGGNEFKVSSDANADKCKVDWYDRWF